MQRRPEEILGVSAAAMPSEIKKAYYAKLRPLRIAFSKEQDNSKKKSLEEEISVLNSAYSILMNPGQKKIEREQPSYEPPGRDPFDFWGDMGQQQQQTRYFDFQFSNRGGQGPQNIWDMFVENFFENPSNSRREIHLDRQVKVKIDVNSIFSESQIILDYTRRVIQVRACPACNSRGCPRCDYSGYFPQESFAPHQVKISLLHKHIFSKKLRVKGGGDILLEGGAKTEGALRIHVELQYPQGEIIVMGTRVLLLMKVPRFLFNGEVRVLEVFKQINGVGGLKVKVNLPLGANQKSFSIKGGFGGKPLQLTVSAS